jgi:hypothetical protein
MNRLGRIGGSVLLGLALLNGCHGTAPPTDPLASAASTPDPKTDWVQVLRALDETGLTRNDKRTITTADEIARLRSFFPDLATNIPSGLHGAWSAWIVLRFHTADGADTYVSSDYRLYRVDDGARGDFVLRPGFSDEIQRLFSPNAGTAAP